MYNVGCFDTTQLPQNVANIVTRPVHNDLGNDDLDYPSQDMSDD